MSAAPHAPARRPRIGTLARRPRTGAVLGRLLAGLVAIGGLVAVVGLVAAQNGWLVVKRGGSGDTVPATLASAGDVTVPTVTGVLPDADSANAGTGSAGTAPLAVDSATAGDSVALPTMDPAHRDSGRAGGDTLAGLGARSAGTGTAPSVTATPADLATLRGRMAVPVRGIAASTLRDDFEQARGGGARRHEALDIMAPRGTPVMAATDGRIVKLFDSAQGGLTVYQADAADRFVLLYGHLDRYEPGLKEGTPVKQGQVIGYVGSTGNADPEGPHLHFAVARSADPARWWSSGTAVNPYLLLRP